MRDNIPHLLTNELRNPRLILPLPQEQFAKKRIQRLLLVAVLLATARVLLLQSREEPLEHEQCALLRVGLGGGGGEERRVLAPVGAEFGQGGGGEDEGRGGKGGEVAVEGGDGLWGKLTC